MNIRLPFIGILCVCVLTVRGSPLQSVTEVSRTQSCCGQLELPITPGCDNTFVRGQWTVAVVTEAEADEGMTQRLDCEDITHIRVCAINDGRVREERIHYHMTCSV